MTTQTGKIYYNSSTNVIIGSFRPNNIKYPGGLTDSFIETEYSIWSTFLEANNGKILKVINDELVAEEIVFTLEQEKLLKKTELKSKRDEYKCGTTLYCSQYRINNALGKIGNGFTEQELEEKKVACEVFVNDLVDKYDNVNDQIKSATTVEQVRNIIINFN